MSDDPVMRDFDRPPSERPDLSDVGRRSALELNDRDNGKRLYGGLGQRMVYAPGLGWGVWDGRRFDFEAGEELALERAGQVLPRMVEEEIAAADARPVPKAQLDAFMAEKDVRDPADAERRIKAGRRIAKKKYAVKCGDNARAKAALEAARALFRAELEALDHDPWRLTVGNGVLDLDGLAAVPEAEEPEERAVRLSAALGPFDPGLRNTRRPGAPYDPEADCPRWRQFVERAFPSPDLGAYLQRALGYLLSGRNDEQVALIFLGQGGNGKSTVSSMLHRVLGGHAAQCRIELFLESRYAGGQGPTPEEAVLPGARIYVASEPEAGAVLSASKIKGMTGGEPRQSRPLHGKPFTWSPHGVPVLSFNKMPKITDESEGMWRRLLPIPFQVKLHELPAGERVSPAEMERIVADEASGILNWLVAGWAEYRALGLAPPEDVLGLKAELRSMSDPVGEFLGDCCERRLGAAIAAKELYLVYAKWCEANGMEALGSRQFNRVLTAKDIRKTKRSTVHWKDLAWLQVADEYRQKIVDEEFR